MSTGIRYVREKNEYKGTWNIPKYRAKKHPLAPKRLMSEFLKYSQITRPQVREQNPDMSNTDVSCL
jgi:HMG (high mobility group) box